jgi:hypothetical protein
VRIFRYRYQELHCFSATKEQIIWMNMIPFYNLITVKVVRTINNKEDVSVKSKVLP